MKYLRSFKIFESKSRDLINIIRDIFIQLDDSGIEYIIDDLEKVGLVHVVIYNQSVVVNDCVDHLVNYLNDLGHEYFIGRSIKDQTHISIDNNFNKGIEKDFLKIINGIREVKHKDFPNSRLWINPYNYLLFEQNDQNKFFYFDESKILRFFISEYDLDTLEICESVRYLVGRHLNLASRPVFKRRTVGRLFGYSLI